MILNNKLWIAQSDKNICLEPALANRHGLIAGATGTGKTITLKVLAESFSDIGVPVFFSDVKGDLSGMCRPGKDSADMQERISRFGIENFSYTSYPTRFWDVFGEEGIPVRMTISDMGPMLLSRLLSLTDTQSGVLNLVFKIADDHGLLLLDLKDLRSMLQYVGDNHAEFTTSYGNVSTASIGAIQRALLAFETEGGEDLFGEPALDIRDWIRTDTSGRGYINILSSKKLIQSPTVYATFLLWMLSDLYETLPEVGDLDKPRIVFFFDEAHLLFADANKALIQKITQIIKLIRSKGVGVYFVTQSPSDVPDEVLAQLGNKVQHALRAFTPAEQKAVKAVANSFRANPEFKTADAILELGVGEALVSFLESDGVPGIVERAKILPPRSLMGAADASDISSIVSADEFSLKYSDVVDRESAYEILVKANEELERTKKEEAEAAAEEKQRAKDEKAAAKLAAAEEKQRLKEEAAAEKEAEKKAAASKKVAQKAANSAASTVTTAMSRNLINSITGGKTTDTKTIAKRAATNALSSVMRSGTSSILRGLFGTKK